MDAPAKCNTSIMFNDVIILTDEKRLQNVTENSYSKNYERQGSDAIYTAEGSRRSVVILCDKLV